MEKQYVRMNENPLKWHQSKQHFLLSIPSCHCCAAQYSHQRSDMVVQGVSVCIRMFCAVVKHKTHVFQPSVWHVTPHAFWWFEMREMGIFCIINLRDKAVMKFWIAVARGTNRTRDFHNGCSCESRRGTGSLYRLNSLYL